MKTTLVLPIFLLAMAGLAQKSTGQNKDAWFDNLVMLYDEGDYWPALLGFERFAETYPNSDLTPRALFNRACLLRKVGKPDEAIAAFKQIMQANYDEYAAYGGLMEQYTLYKNRSAKHLAELYLEAGSYREAGVYIRKFDKEYPYRHFCGNELTANAIYTATMYARYLNGMGQREKAVGRLLPYAFENGLAGNQEVLELLREYLPKAYDRKTIQEELGSAIEGFQAHGKESGTLTLFGVKIPISEYAFYDQLNLVLVDWEGLDWAGKLETLFRNHPVFGSYLSF